MSRKETSSSHLSSDILSQAMNAIASNAAEVSEEESGERDTMASNSQPCSAPPPSSQASSLEDTLSFMKVELTMAKDTIASQDAEISRLRAKCLQLENEASTGKSTFKSKDSGSAILS